MHVENASFRDPSGQVWTSEGNKVIRIIKPSYFDDYRKLMKSGLYQILVDSNLLIPHKEINTGVNEIIIEPEFVPFISYPYEWCFSMLQQAAINTLRINQMAMQFGMILKDASAYNIQWHKGNLVLIDTLSFMTYQPGTPWGAYRQFIQHFLYPLLVMQYRDAYLGAHLSEVYLDGIPAGIATKLIPYRLHFKPMMLAHVYAQALNFTVSSNRTVTMSRPAFDALLNNLLGLVASLKYKPKSSKTKYNDGDSYTSEAQTSKDYLVLSLISNRFNKISYCDLGCNTGRYSSDALIAVDSDHDCIEYLASHKHRFLPLVIDLCNPSPAIGWANTERKSFWERVQVDTIMALALIHHLCVANNIPLANVASLLANHCKNLIIEFVPLDDPKAKLLLGKKNIPLYSLDIFKAEFGKYFVTKQEYPITDSLRTIYLMERR